MKPERELLMDQATACRQLALIADAAVADQLKALATEYETLALVDKKLVRGSEPSASLTGSDTDTGQIKTTGTARL
jgi:hypothetical protein